jgi:hypothetical protein
MLIIAAIGVTDPLTDYRDSLSCSVKLITGSDLTFMRKEIGPMVIIQDNGRDRLDNNGDRK